MEIIFIQTCDITYRPLLEATSQTVREYCSRHKFSHESYFGIIRGHHPWHAAYNRILLLERLVKADFAGWVCYLDADAFIVDMNFDLSYYLAEKSDIAFIAAPGGPPRVWWNVNDGVFLINLGSNIGRLIVHEWAMEFNKVSDEQLREARTWPSSDRPWSSITDASISMSITGDQELFDDQEMLWRALQRVPGAEMATLVEDSEPLLINYHGSFIQQVLRSSGGLDDRIHRVRASVRDILRETGSLIEPERDIPVERVYESFISAIYRVLLQREPDPEGFVTAINGIKSGKSLDQELRDCLGSKEFAGKVASFIRNYVK